MKIEMAEILAKELMAQYKIDGYTFKFDDSVRRFGYCNNHSKIISLSKHLTELNSEDRVRNTILHEIAHALTPDCNHNEVWKRVARAIGCDGERCYDSELVETPTHKWTATCPKCGHSFPRHKRNKRLHCSSCYKNNGKRFSDAFRFRWSLNKVPVA